jgi:hypothetical protein
VILNGLQAGAKAQENKKMTVPVATRRALNTSLFLELY